MSNIHLLIATPCYGCQVFYQYTTSLLRTIEECKKYNINVEVYFIGNESLITRARNTCVSYFHNNKQFTHLLFIDADISWNPTDVIKLLSHNKDVIGGIYPQKAYFWEKMKNIDTINELHKNKHNISVPDDVFLKHNLMTYNVVLNDKVNQEIKNNLLEVKYIPTGFLLIQRNVIDIMIEKYEDTKYFVPNYGDNTVKDDNPFKTCYAIFDCKVVDEHYLSEDWYFSHRWINECSGNIYTDVTIELTHIGTHHFDGRLLSTLAIN